MLNREKVDIEAMTADALERVNAALYRLPLIELPTFHSFLWFDREPLERLITNLKKLGFVVTPIRTLTKVDEIGLEKRFFEAIVSRKAEVSADAIKKEALECLSKAKLYGVVYDHLWVDTSPLEHSV